MQTEIVEKNKEKVETEMDEILLFRLERISCENAVNAKLHKWTKGQTTDNNGKIIIITITYGLASGQNRHRRQYRLGVAAAVNSGRPWLFFALWFGLYLPVSTIGMDVIDGTRL